MNLFFLDSYNCYTFVLDIHLDKSLSYKLKFLAITGDSPALKLALNFVGHGGYWCCWLCYLKGVHVAGKRQYYYEMPINHRNAREYLQESIQAEKEGRDIFGHRGVSLIHKILDIPLPQSVIIDYLHSTLLGHAKAVILDIYKKLKPAEREAIDPKLKNQACPHFFNRKMKPISEFGFVKATEVRNVLFYAILPLLLDYVPIDQLGHLALYICSMRLFHTESLHGDNICTIAHELFTQYYQDHEYYYSGLQNLVLHKHIHYSLLYRNYGALCNLGCFAQEDFIGSISSNHNSTKAYGEAICFYHNIDFFLSNSLITKTSDGPIDPTGQALTAYKYVDDVHAKLCTCNYSNKCLIIYRRCVIREEMFHSLLYTRCSKSISYFVEYFVNGSGQHNLGIILYFLTCNSKAFALIERSSIRQKFSDYFKRSRYYNLLKKPLDSFFTILEKKTSIIDLVAIENISKHCIVFDKKDYIIVTTVSSYGEHD